MLQVYQDIQLVLQVRPVPVLRGNRFCRLFRDIQEDPQVQVFRLCLGIQRIQEHLLGQVYQGLQGSPVIQGLRSNLWVQVIQGNQDDQLVRDGL